jgi:hypothetical protein
MNLRQNLDDKPFKAGLTSLALMVDYSIPGHGGNIEISEAGGQGKSDA